MKWQEMKKQWLIVLTWGVIIPAIGLVSYTQIGIAWLVLIWFGLWIRFSDTKFAEKFRKFSA